jgi:hypothetical protein
MRAGVRILSHERSMRTSGIEPGGASYGVWAWGSSKRKHPVCRLSEHERVASMRILPSCGLPLRRISWIDGNCPMLPRRPVDPVGQRDDPLIDRAKRMVVRLRSCVI